MLDKIKSDIQKLSQEQRLLKPQRKTVYFTGTRTTDPGMAQAKVADNKNRLRHLYILYGTLQGKTLDEIEPNRTTQPSDWFIERLKFLYAKAEEEVAMV